MTITLKEQVNKQHLSYIIDNSDNFGFEDYKVNGKTVTVNGQLTMLKKYYNSLNAEGIVKMAYYQRNGKGRHWSGTGYGIQNMWKKVRHTVCRDIYHDIDMKNAHPTLLRFYCSNNNITCDALEDYIDNRDECLKEFMKHHDCDKDYAKKSYLAVMNGGTPPKNRTERFESFVKETLIIQKTIFDIEPELAKLAKDSKRKQGKGNYNIKGTCTNYVMCNLEDTVLMSMVDFFKTQKIKVGALAFDGLMILKKDVIGKNLGNILDKCMIHIEKVVGVNMVILEKPMNDGVDLENVDIDTKTTDYNVIDPEIDDIFQPISTMENGYVDYPIDIPENVMYVQDLDFTHSRCLAIKSALGSGKTTAITRYINDNNVKRVLVLSPRISFAQSITEEYNESVSNGDPFVCYRKIKEKKKLINEDRLVISMQSLHYLDGIFKNSQYIPFDLLVVDESQANLVAHLSRKTNDKHLENNIYVFERLLKRSKAMVFADAFLGPKTLNFLDGHSIPTRVLNYKRTMTSREAIEIKGKGDCLLDEILKSLSRDERSYCFIASKSRLTKWESKIRETYPDKSIITYTGGSSAEIHPKEDWIDADLIMTTSTITVGINFPIKDVFHNIFIYASSRVPISVADVFQSHYRVRHLILNRLYFYLYENFGSYKNTSYDSLEESLDWKEKTFESKNTQFQRVTPQVKQLILDNQFEQNMSEVHLRSMFMRFLDSCNYSLVLPRETVDLDFDFSVNEKFDFEDIKLINEFEASAIYDKINKGIDVQDNEKLELDKKIFVNCFSYNGIAWLKREHVGFLWEKWVNHGRSKIAMLRKEKQLSMGLVTFDELFEQDVNKCSLSALQKNKLLKLDFISKFVKELRIEHSQDTMTIIPYCLLERVHNIVSKEYNNIRKSFDLRSKTKEVSIKTTISIVNSALKSYGDTKLARYGPYQRTVKGKKVLIEDPDYKLERTDKNMPKDLDIWNYIELEKKHKRLLPIKK
jgi:hypothetical protein